MRIIPAIDLMDGQCVRLSEGDFTRRVTYHRNPLEMARLFEGHGLRYLHLVDLDGAKAGGGVNYKLLERLASQTSLTIDFGGGLRCAEDIERALNCGASQVNVGSMAVENETDFVACLKWYGACKIMLSADCRQGQVFISGWQSAAAREVLPFIRWFEQQGGYYTVVTDIARDGMLQGPATELYKKIMAETRVKLIASGGVSSLNDLASLKAIGCDAAIVGKALYEGCITLKELSELC